MTLEAGAIAHWRDFEPGHHKFIYILATNRATEVLSFTISSQTKYLTMQPMPTGRYAVAGASQTEFHSGVRECINPRSDSADC